MLTPALPQSFSIKLLATTRPPSTWVITIKGLTSTKVHEPINLLVATRACVRRVLRDHEPVRAQRLGGVAPEDVALDQHLVIGARVDRLVVEVLVVVVVHVLVAEAACGAAGAAVLVAVVVEGDVQVAAVDVAEGVVVADEVGLVVVVEVVPRDGDPVRGANDVYGAVLFRC